MSHDHRDDPTDTSLTYKRSGVDIETADVLVKRFAALAKATHTEGVMPGHGAYASLFRPRLGHLQDPLIATTCDGVGTKVLVARDVGWFAGLGQDLVAMNVNDLLPVGAKPLLFLDYIAAGKLNVDTLETVVAGVAAACTEAGCALVGGETAEMPDVYARDDFDLAGFALGLVDGANVPSGDAVTPGDWALALPSRGVHANGLSLARRALFDRGNLAPGDVPAGFRRSVGRELLEPTAIYVAQVLQLMDVFRVKAAAHITGGGLLGRAQRLVGAGRRLILDSASYERPPIFDLIARCGGVTDEEMARTFNMGLGYVVIVAPDDAREILSRHRDWLDVGRVVEGNTGVDLGYATS